jgi:nitroreductase
MSTCPSREEIIAILEVGCRAASAYNLQPWRFRIDGNRVSVFIQKERGGYWDFFPISYYAIGCLLENILEGARHYGCSASYTLVSHTLSELEPVAELEFEKKSDGQSHDVGHVVDRYTNRRLYHDTAVPEPVLRQIPEIFEDESSRVVDVSGNRIFIDCCTAIERIRFRNHFTFREIINYILFDEDEVARSRDRLDVRTLVLSGVAARVLRSSQRRFVARVVSRVAGARLAAGYQRRLLLNTPTLLLFVNTSPQTESLVASWMRFQRIMNFLHAEGLSSHLLCSSIDLLKLKTKIFSPRELNQLAAQRRRLEDLAGAEAHTFLGLLRVGFADPCPVRSLRKDVEELLI